MTSIRAIRVLAFAIAITSLATTGCNDAMVVDETERQIASGITSPNIRLAKAIPDVAGSWTWNAFNQSAIPEEFVLPVLGPTVQPEGPLTHFTCEVTGTMTLLTSEANFEGPANQTLTCETKGGQSFTPPDAFFPSTFSVENGAISGNSVHFETVGGSCTFHGRLQAEGGLAVAMSATGVCTPPVRGVPKNKVLTFEASRSS
jgi:hypothetical protein